MRIYASLGVGAVCGQREQHEIRMTEGRKLDAKENIFPDECTSVDTEHDGRDNDVSICMGTTIEKGSAERERSKRNERRIRGVQLKQAGRQGAEAAARQSQIYDAFHKTKEDTPHVESSPIG